MACLHKFNKHLHLEHLGFEPATLVVGTFNPAWPANNTAEWFYGRTLHNYFWDVLPRLYGRDSLINATPAEWKQFCHDKQVAITDLIMSIDDADPAIPEHNRMLGGFSDEAIMHNFDDLNYVDIVQLLQRYPSIKNVYLTRGITEAFWRHLWNPVMHYCNVNGLHEAKLLTPSGNARFQHGKHNKDYPDDVVASLEDYILRKWQEEWHF